MSPENIELIFEIHSSVIRIEGRLKNIEEKLSGLDKLGCLYGRDISGGIKTEMYNMERRTKKEIQDSKEELHEKINKTNRFFGSMASIGALIGAVATWIYTRK